MAWDDNQSTGDEIDSTEWNNMRDYIKSAINAIDSIDVSTFKLNGTAVTSTATEINYTDGVTANIQTQLDTKLENVVEDTSPQLGGNLDLNSNGTKIVSQTVGGSNGDAVYLSSADTWSQADASTESTCDSQLGIRISSTEVLTHGVYTTSGLTAGDLYYVSETAGGITNTAPTTSTSIVRVIGYAISTTELMVDPDKTYIELS